MKTAIIIASTGRAEILHETVVSLGVQSEQPDQIIISVSDRADILEETASWQSDVRVVHGPRGLPRQRNRAVAALAPDIDLVLFMDDDAELRSDYVRTMVGAFAAAPDVVLMSGRELADGSDRASARMLLSADERAFHPSGWQLSSNDISDDVWGTNMAVRRQVLDRVRFDERLPLYAWLEDFDFALQCAAYGRVARVENCRIVHLKTRSGRISPLRLGFAQTLNPIYIWRKGYPDYPASTMLKLVGRSLVGSILKLPADPLHRLNRLRGSLIALGMILRGDLRPERMAELP